MCVAWHRITVLIHSLTVELGFDSRATCCPQSLLRSHGTRGCSSLHIAGGLVHRDSRWALGSWSTIGDNAATDSFFGFTDFSSSASLRLPVSQLAPLLAQYLTQQWLRLQSRPSKVTSGKKEQIKKKRYGTYRQHSTNHRIILNST